MSPSERYTRTAIALHWLIAALVLVELAHGWWMQEIPKQPPGLRADAFNLHKSAGLVVLALMLIRLGWRIAHRPPALPPMLKWQALLAKANHVLLYTMVIAMPLSGYLGSVFSGYPIKWFGVTLPAWGWADPTIKDWMSVVHLTTSWILLVSLCLHITGTIKHTLAGDRVMARMGLGGKTADTRAPAAAVSAPPG
jgi:cytochrome b561